MAPRGAPVPGADITSLSLWAACVEFHREAAPVAPLLTHPCLTVQLALAQAQVRLHSCTTGSGSSVKSHSGPPRADCFRCPGLEPWPAPLAPLYTWAQQSAPTAWWKGWHFGGLLLSLFLEGGELFFVNCHMFGRHDRKGGVAASGRKGIPFVESQFSHSGCK